MRRALLSLAAAATLHGGSCKLNDLEARFISQPDAETAREYHGFKLKNGCTKATTDIEGHRIARLTGTSAMSVLFVPSHGIRGESEIHHERGAYGGHCW